MDSSKTIDAGTSEQSLRQQISSVDLDNVRAKSLANIDRLAAEIDNDLRIDLGEIQERMNKSFRQFLLDREQERYAFFTARDDFSYRKYGRRTRIPPSASSSLV
ncbi:MAG: hypothetical protein HC778_08885 [Chamaesiphon sp. CSU_1_12]|nr:hypothetical protein [Chamaesiphon sp. CSU_1_12]